ncbi:phosphoglycolate phosphatase [Tabrizicola sp.]|uniref:phosphoglycolate phosphatase n=1 Tax=Tabrizicola sp. TaxID=2005166 RepID=UPI0035B1DA45
MPEPLNLVFDLDGTLIDSAPQIHAAANEVFAARGLPGFAFATVRGFIGNGVGVLVSRLLAHQGLECEGPLQRDLVADFMKIYEQAFDLTSLYPGAAEALGDLAAAGHQLAICTNKPEAPARAVLHHFGLAKLFPVVIGGDSLARRKPDPAPLHAAIAALGPARTLFIGDSEIDAETAQAADVPLALFSGGYRKAVPEEMGARLVFDHHAALPRLIAQL